MESGMKRRKNAGTSPREDFEHLNSEQNGIDEVENNDDFDLNLKPYSPALTLMDELFLLGLKDEGHLSFWNDSISYVLRGVLIGELVLRNRIQFYNIGDNVNKLPNQKKVEVIRGDSTDEFLLDEAIKLMLTSNEQLDITSWVAYLNGETWNLNKLGYQLKMVRERIAKGLVEKGVLRHDIKSYVMFEVSAYPIRAPHIRRDLVSQVRSLLTLPYEQVLLAIHHPVKSQTPFLRMRRILITIASHTAHVLDNWFDEHQLDSVMFKGEELIKEFQKYPPSTKTLQLLGIEKHCHVIYLPYLELISAVINAMANT